MVEEYVISYKELLGIAGFIVAVITVVIMVYGAMLRRILSEALRNEARSEAKKIMLKLGTKTLIDIGYVYWKDYKISKKEEYLKLAISVTEQAYNDFARYLDESENELLICWLKNNLAYYYAMRGRLEDGVVARQYAEYLHDRLHKYHEPRSEFLDTYRYVQQEYPKSQLDIYLKK